MTVSEEAGLRRGRDADGVDWLRFDRPTVRNAMDGDTLAALRDACRQIADDENARALVLAGGPPAFCAGADLGWMAQLQEQGRTSVASEVLHAALEALGEVPVPVVVVVDGAAVGAGVALAACADVVIATEESWFSVPEVAAGIVPEAVVPYLVRRIGSGRCRFWTLTGLRVPASEAQAAGLVHRVVPAAALDEEVRSQLAALLAGRRDVVRATKSLLDRTTSW